MTAPQLPAAKKAINSAREWALRAWSESNANEKLDPRLPAHHQPAWGGRLAVEAATDA